MPPHSTHAVRPDRIAMVRIVQSTELPRFSRHDRRHGPARGSRPSRADLGMVPRRVVVTNGSMELDVDEISVVRHQPEGMITGSDHLPSRPGTGQPDARTPTY